MLGVDPGLTRCGIAVVDGPPARPVLVTWELVTTPPRDRLESRLAALHSALTESIARWRPDAVACEQVVFSVNARTAMAVGQAAGVALLAAAQAGLEVTSYSPTELKLSVAGDGAAEKSAVARVVAAQLRLSELPRSADVTDAIAVALCHLTRARIARAAAAAGART